MKKKDTSKPAPVFEENQSEQWITEWPVQLGQAFRHRSSDPSPNRIPWAALGGFRMSHQKSSPRWIKPSEAQVSRVLPPARKALPAESQEVCNWNEACFGVEAASSIQSRDPLFV